KSTRESMRETQDTLQARSGDPLNQPENSQVERLLLQLRDTMMLAPAERGGARAVDEYITPPRVVSILEVATAVGQPVSTLLNLNSGRVEDFFRIPPRTALRKLQ